MSRKQVHPESSGRTTFCAVDTDYPRPDGDNRAMGFLRSIKLLLSIRLDLGKRGIATSIGVRGANVAFGKTGTRTTVRRSRTGLSYTHLNKPRGARLAAPASEPLLDSSASPDNDWRELLCIALIVFAVAAAAAQVMK